MAGTKPLSAYRGRVLLLDFWATWCVPCIDALPELRQLVADLPADRFALLAISVDEDLTTVIEFMTDEPMPWENWHVGVSSELERMLDVRGFPTYLLADEDGVILANGNASLAQLRCMAERAVAGDDPDLLASELALRPANRFYRAGPRWRSPALRCIGGLCETGQRRSRPRAGRSRVHQLDSDHMLDAPGSLRTELLEDAHASTPTTWSNTWPTNTAPDERVQAWTTTRGR